MMGEPPDPPTRVPDPTKRSRVLGVTRGAEVYVEIYDEVEKRGVVLTFPEAFPFTGGAGLPRHDP